MRVLLFLIFLSFPVVGADQKILKVGEIPPDFLGHSLNGKKIYLSDFKNKVVVLCFWSTGNQQSFRELAVLHLFQQQLNDDRLEVVAINLDKHKKFSNRLAKAFGVTDINFTYEPLIMARNRRDKIGSSYGIYSNKKIGNATYASTGLKTFLIHPNGKIASIHNERNDQSRNLLLSEIKALIHNVLDK